LKDTIAVKQDLIKSFEKALDQLKLDWPDWKPFKKETKCCEWLKNEKNERPQFTLIDKTSNHECKGNIENLHKSLVMHAKIKYDFDNYSRFQYQRIDQLFGCRNFKFLF
jgi:hypothetical protein